MEVLSLLTVMDDAPFKKNARYTDLGNLPDNWVGEIIDGDLYASPRPLSIHIRAIGQLHHQVDNSDNDPKSGWLILAEPQIRFGRHLLVPDLAGWRRSRMPEMPNVATFDLTPDWVCEGLSPSTARIDQGRKREIYAKHGVGHVWWVNPELRTLEVLVLDDSGYRMASAGGGNKRGVFAPFTRRIDLSKLWAR
jgi:Uma2 family endonuclease